MSPEQARGLGELDARSDIYSLGAVAYALLTGRPPFDGTNPLDVMIAHVRDEVNGRRSISADVPADLERVVLRCLAKSPEDRFQDVYTLEQALAECAAAEEWTQRHRQLVARDRPNCGDAPGVWFDREPFGRRSRMCSARRVGEPDGTWLVELQAPFRH